jgi:hypothetical protein
LIFGLLLKMPLFLYPKASLVTANDAVFYQGFVQWLGASGTGSTTLFSITAFVLLYVQALIINYFINSFRMISKPTYLPAMAYLLITSLLPEWNYLSSPLMATTLVLWALVILFRLYNVQVARGAIFNIGLLLGLGSCFYFPVAAFLLSFLLGMMILKPFRINEIVLLLLGALTPYYFYGTYLFLNNQLSFQTFLPKIGVNVPVVESNVWLAVSTVLLAIPFLVGGFYVQNHLHKMLIQVRKNWSILLFYLVMAFFVPFINIHASFSNWILIAAPFACFHAATYFYLPRKWVANLLFLLTTGFILYQQYGTPLWH